MNQAKVYLSQIKKLDFKIRRRQQEAAELYEAAKGLSAMQLDPDRVRPLSPDPDPMASKIGRCVDLQKEVEQMIVDLMELKHTIIGQIQMLDNERYMELLWKRYIDLEPYDQIAREMNCDIRHVFRIHGQALKLFEKMFLKMS